MPDLITREGIECEASFWRGVASGLRNVLVAAHILFGLPILFRHNIPLLFTSYANFDDQIVFWVWGAASLTAAALLLLLPARAFWGLVSSAFSAFISLFIGAMFALAGGFFPETNIFTALGLTAGVLFMRTLWFSMLRVSWFQREVLDRTVNWRGR